MNSWKTTLSGIAGILAGIVMGLRALTGEGPADFAGAIAAVTAGVGLLLARDNDKSSESAGAK
jgi:hypothetical protein